MKTVNADGTVGADPDTVGPTVDLTPVRVGMGTFQNPCFWILVGIIGTLAVQHFITSPKRRD